MSCTQSNKPSCSVLADRALARPGQPCTSPTEILQNAQWRMATALGATPDAGPRATCALREGNDGGDMCEHSLARHPCHPFCYKFGEEPRPDRTEQSSQAHRASRGATRAWSHVPQKRSSTRRAVRRHGLLVSCSLAETLDRRHRTMPACRTLQRKCVESRGGCRFWERLRKRSDTERPFNRWSSRDVRKTGRRRHQVVA